MRSWTSLWLVASMILAAACVEQEPAKPSAEDMETIKKNTLKQAPKMKYQVNADLEGNVVYLGLDVSPDPIRPGARVTLTHYWKVNKPVPGWRIFVHVNSPDRKRFINADHKPIGGRYPATFWKAGEIIRDEHTVTIPANWRQPEIQIYTGLWKGKLRMKPKGPQDAENRVKAAVVKVLVAAAPKPAPLKRLLAVKTAKPVKIDGKLDDAAWAKAPSSGAFVHPGTGRAARVQSEVKVAWDEKNLYFAFDNKDEDVWSDLKKRDDKLWTQDAVEIFIDANGDGKDYIELQVNPNGAVFDSYLPARRRNQNEWNSKLRAKVAVDGTVNKREDKDKGWTVEIAVPWADVKGKGSYELKTPPDLGNVWRVNFFRMDKPAKGPQLAAAWSPPLTNDFHEVGRFGELVFADAEGKLPAPKPAAAAPAKVGATAGAAVPVVAPVRGKVLRMAAPPRRNLMDLRRRRPAKRLPKRPAAAAQPAPAQPAK